MELYIYIHNKRNKLTLIIKKKIFIYIIENICKEINLQQYIYYI